jgi:uncharacterized membrane protein
MLKKFGKLVMDVGLLYAIPLIILAASYWIFVIGLSLTMFIYGVAITYGGIRESNMLGTIFGLLCFAVCYCLLDNTIFERKR